MYRFNSIGTNYVIVENFIYNHGYIATEKINIYGDRLYVKPISEGGILYTRIEAAKRILPMSVRNGDEKTIPDIVANIKLLYKAMDRV